ncbi:TPA: anti-FlhDC factor, partial [Escherichia coli]|nr:anti-FlhDC factor [Escherichia coli]
NRGLLSLSQVYPLVLGNLGAGNSTMKAVFDGLFTRVMLDKSFIQQQITHRSFEPFIRAIQAQISPCCNCIIAGGIDTPEILAQITPFDFHALQGCLWPAVPINQITTLVQR